MELFIYYHYCETWSLAFNIKALMQTTLALKDGEAFVEAVNKLCYICHEIRLIDTICENV